MAFTVGVLTVSDKGARGAREDTSGAAIRELVAGVGGAVTQYAIVPDEADQIAAGINEPRHAADPRGRRRRRDDPPTSVAG